MKDLSVASRKDSGASLILVLFAITFVAGVMGVILTLTQTGFLSGSKLSSLQANRLDVENALQSANGFVTKGTASCPTNGGTLLTYKNPTTNNQVSVTCTNTYSGLSGPDNSGGGLANLTYGWSAGVILNDPATSFIQHDDTYCSNGWWSWGNYNNSCSNSYQGGYGGTFLVQGNLYAKGQASIGGTASNFASSACSLATASALPTTQMTTPGCLQTVVNPGAVAAAGPSTGSTHVWSTVGETWSSPIVPVPTFPAQLPTTAKIYTGLVGSGTSGTSVPAGVASCANLSGSTTCSTTNCVVVLSPGYYTASNLNTYTDGSQSVGGRSCQYSHSYDYGWWNPTGNVNFVVIMQPGYYYFSMDADWIISGGTTVVGGFESNVTGGDTNLTDTSPVKTATDLTCDSPSAQSASSSSYDSGVVLTLGNSSASKVRNGIVVTDSGYRGGDRGTWWNPSANSNSFQLCAGFSSTLAAGVGAEPVSMYGLTGSNLAFTVGGSSKTLYPATSCTAANSDPSTYSTSSTACPILTNPMYSGSTNNNYTSQVAGNDADIGINGAIYAPTDSIGLVLNAPAAYGANNGDWDGNYGSNCYASYWNSWNYNCAAFSGSVLITFGVDLYGLNVLNTGWVPSSWAARCPDHHEGTWCTQNTQAWQPTIAAPVTTITGMTLTASAGSGSVTGTETVAVSSGKLTVLTWKE